MKIRKLVWGLLVLTSCGPEEAIRDPSFQLWCGDRLCEWELESGEIDRIPTWHEQELGLRFASRDTAISQKLDIDPGACLFFRILADVSPAANFRLEFDVLDDGVVDQSQRIAVRRFQAVEFIDLVPMWTDQVRLRLIADTGSVRIAQIRAQAIARSECGLRDPIEVPDRPLGAGCVEGRQCASEICSRNVCTLCANDSDCSEGEVCNRVLAEAGSPLSSHQACVPKGSVAQGEPCTTSEACERGVCALGRCGCDDETLCPEGDICGTDEAGRHLCESPGQETFGERCSIDAECREGTCCQGVCSLCCSDADCEHGRCLSASGRALDEPNALPTLPYRCAALQGSSQAGVSCFVDDDCANGSCSGDDERGICAFGNEPCDADEACGDFNACVPLGFFDGVCE